MGWLEDFKSGKLSMNRYDEIINRLTVIAEASEWVATTNDMNSDNYCHLCSNMIDEGHKVACHYHEDWTP